MGSYDSQLSFTNLPSKINHWLINNSFDHCTEYLRSPPSTLDKPIQTPKCPWHEPSNHNVPPEDFHPKNVY